MESFHVGSGTPSRSQFSFDHIAESLGDLGESDAWYVSNGSNAVGPVSLELLARGIHGGRVPLESFVRHDTWKVWRPLIELLTTNVHSPSEVSFDNDALNTRSLDKRGEWPSPVPFTLKADALTSSDSEEAVAESAAIFDAATSTPGSPRVNLLESDFLDEESLTTDDISAPARAALPGERTAADAFAGAADRKDAQLLLLAAIIHDLGAEGAILHEITDEGAIAACAHGPQMFDILGTKTRLLDPTLVAAASGRFVIAEPMPGPAGAAILERLALLGLVVDGAVMFPIRPNNRLLAMVEAGRATPFTMIELGKIAELVAALEAHIESLSAS
jgi:hypothetical protein